MLNQSMAHPKAVAWHFDLQL